MNWLTDILFWLLGVKVPAGTRLVHTALAFRGTLHWGWVALLTIVLGALVVWMYRRTAHHVHPMMRYSMAALRTIFLLLLFIILLRPVLALTLEGSVRRTLIIMIDGTLSMKTADPREEPDDLKRSAMALDKMDPTKGLGQDLPAGLGPQVAQATRIDLLKAVLKNSQLNLLKRLASEYDLRVYTFGRNPKTQGTLTELTPTVAPSDETKQGKPPEPKFDWIEGLTASSPVTPIGDSLREVWSSTRGLPGAGIWILTDGGNNAGSDPLLVAQTMAGQGEESLPIYTYGVGLSSPKDIIVANIFGPEVSFVKDEVGVTVRVRGQNMKGQTAKLKLLLIEGKTESMVDSRDVTFGADGEQTIPMKFTPVKPGEFQLKALIDPVANEASKTNNEAQQPLRVVDGKIKVLMVDRQPRWEFADLMAQLLRDRRVDLHCILTDAGPGVAASPNSPYLAKFPDRKEDLFKYDLIVLGDVDPAKLSAKDLDNISEFVTKFGGGFLMIAGRQFSPQKYAHTPIEKMLPVEIDPTSSAMGSGDVADKPFRLELTEKGKHSRMLQLSDKPTESAQRWLQLPPIFWDARVSRAKPAAEVLMVDPDPIKMSRSGKMPVMALQQYGLGQVLFMGTDNTWRWRKNKGDQFYITLWGQVVQRLSLPHMLGASKRTQLSTDKETYAAGERVTVYARLYSEGYEPIAEPAVRAYVGTGKATETASTNDHEVQLKTDPDQPGLYRVEFIAGDAGTYKFHVGPPGDPTVFLNFNVVEPTNEAGETAMNEPLLRDLAKISNGTFYREEDLYKLPDNIRLKTEHVRSTQELEIWSTGFYFSLLLLVVTAEWILRKLAQLK